MRPAMIPEERIRGYRVDSPFRASCLVCKAQIKNNRKARLAHERSQRHRDLLSGSLIKQWGEKLA